MRRREIIKRITKAAKTQGFAFTLDREGANHSVYKLNDTIIPIPRHNEIGEGLAREIFKECSEVLGKEWWK
jgi:hypothetical protein